MDKKQKHTTKTCADWLQQPMETRAAKKHRVAAELERVVTE